MKKVLAAALVVAGLAVASPAHATPSTVYWTPATTYTQPFAVPHLTYDTYVAEQGALANTYGLTLGVIPGDKIQGEIGFDLFYPGYTKDLFQLNAKLTLVEGALGEWSPGVSVGIMNVGFKSDVSNYDMAYLALGKTTPYGTFGVGGYYGAGSKALWTGGTGKVARPGAMVSYVSPDIKVGLPGLDKLNVIGDLYTGKNWMGAVGGGLCAYFNSNVAVIMGPVFFLDTDYYSAAKWMWTVQLDVDIPTK